MREAKDQQAKAEHEADVQDEVLRRKRANPGRSVADIRNEVESGN